MGDISTHGDQIAISEIFHSNFGDFALQSSDGPVFYFPKAILQYSSKVFETMFEVGTASSQGKPILIQADSKTLDLLLRFLHPAMLNPSVDNIDTLASLLRVTHQYEMESTIHVLKNYFILPFAPASNDSLITKEPLASLIVSYSYGYREIARAAFKGVIKCDLRSQIEKAEGYDIPLVLLKHIYTKRQELIEEHVDSIIALGSRSRVIHTRVQNDIFAIQKQAIVKVTRQPSFSPVRAAFKALTEGGMLDENREDLDAWEAQVLEMESQLPEL